MSSKANMKKFLIIILAVISSMSRNANADFVFGTPTNLGKSVNTSSRDGLACTSADGLSLFFASQQSGGYGAWDLWIATRATIEDPWEEPVNLGPTVNSSSWELGPDMSDDGLTLFLQSNRPGGQGSQDLWVTTRTSITDPWGPPVNLGSLVNSSGNEVGPSISSDGYTLFFSSNRSGGHGGDDLYISTRQTLSDDWEAPLNLGPTVNTGVTDRAPSISSDGRMLFFHSNRPGGHGLYDLYVTMRSSVTGTWGTPMNLGSTVNSSVEDVGPSISDDGQTLFFMSMRSGGFGSFDAWQVSITPIVDFNGDGIVDVEDVVVMTEHWGENYPLCDIGPSPLGDGIVDARDLLVLAEHMQPEPTPIAHWELDETEGDIAYDSAGDNFAYVIGSPVWQPTGGMVNGALQLDGVDDCVVTGSIPNPTEGPFSVFAWVKGGAPGQVVLSQMGGARWLCTDSLEGNLITELKGTGRDATELLSQTIITDGNWHRIGLVWDGSHRTLYVDEVAVAEDTQTNLEASENGLYIGAGRAMEPGTFWSGLIDDVRIYNRAVKP